MRHKNYRTPQIPASDSEIAADLLVVENVRLLGRLAHLFDRDRIQIGEEGFSPALRTAGSITRSSSTEFEPRSSGSAVLSDIAVRNDLTHSDTPTLAREFVAASRPGARP